jgi:hypothetical protein
MAAQENDGDFTTSGHTVLEADILEYYRQQIKEPLERRGIAQDLWIWEVPNYTRSYVITADVSRGDGEDYSAFIVFDVESCRQVAEFKAFVDTNMFGRLLVSIATEYNDALLVIDNKNIGWSTVQYVLDSGYKNLYYSYKHDPYLDENIQFKKQYDMKNKEDMTPGFTINTIIRPVMISKMQEYTREKMIAFYSTRLVNEFNVFMWLNGKPQAQNGYNDDLVMCVGMFLYVRDTALKLRQLGIELIRSSITNIHKTVYKTSPSSMGQWQHRIGNKNESLKWLL